MPAREKEQQATQWLTCKALPIDIVTATHCDLERREMRMLTSFADWAIYGVISAAEQLFETRPPLYYHLKLAFLFWLQNSRYQVWLACFPATIFGIFIMERNAQS